MGMLQDFRDFLVKDNALALAIGVIIGGAMGKLVGSITDDLIMPVVGVLMPDDSSWQTWGIALNADNTMKIGAFGASLVNLLIVGFVCFILLKLLVRKKPA
ncbi:MAG TPA: MscL family protein [Gemmatimonadaceae bacterium]|nr:MscL family protein [Gemmatimonadaceae bacterium]